MTSHMLRSNLASIHSRIFEIGKRSICHLRINDCSQATATLICVIVENNPNFRWPIFSLVTAYHVLKKEVVDNLDTNIVDIEFMNKDWNFRLRKEDLGEMQIFRSNEDIDITLLEFSLFRYSKLQKQDAYFLFIGSPQVGHKIVLQGFPGDFGAGFANLFYVFGLITADLPPYSFKSSASGPRGYSGGALIAEDLSAVGIHCRYNSEKENDNIAFNLSKLGNLVEEDFPKGNSNRKEEISYLRKISNSISRKQIESNLTKSADAHLLNGINSYL